MTSHWALGGRRSGPTVPPRCRPSLPTPQNPQSHAGNPGEQGSGSPRLQPPPGARRACWACRGPGASLGELDFSRGAGWPCFAVARVVTEASKIPGDRERPLQRPQTGSSSQRPRCLWTEARCAAVTRSGMVPAREDGQGLSPSEQTQPAEPQGLVGCGQFPEERRSRADLLTCAREGPGPRSHCCPEHPWAPRLRLLFASGLLLLEGGSVLTSSPATQVQALLGELPQEWNCWVRG